MEKFLLQIIKRFGKNNQMAVCIEEMAELTQVLCKFIIDHPKKSKENLIEEFSDVEIMLNQIRIIFDIDRQEIDKIKQSKLKRLSKIYNISIQNEL